MAVVTALRICSSCSEALPFSAFHRTANGRDGLHSRCKPCRKVDAKARAALPGAKEAARAATKRWRERTPIYRQRQYTRAKFNMEPEVILAYVASYVKEHGPNCASCGRECDVVGGVKTAGKRRLVLDHCHETGALRGMLCDFCNTALGKLGDSPQGVAALLAYIRRTDTRGNQ